VLSTRPIFHKLDETIRGHVFCSFLALVLKKARHSSSDPWAWPRPERPVDYALAAGSLQADKAGASAERQIKEEAVARAAV
jgi:hypothetical protein